MPKSIVIVESPAKAKTIEKFLGKGYEVKASYGHIRDLPTFGLGVDIANNFTPTYKPLKEKAKVIETIKKLAAKADYILLATDPDREGEAIAWHIQETADLPKEKTKRIVFHEITKDAVSKALENAREINKNLVNAQQARRVLDRLIGYKLSPILNKKIRKGLSAGRVQSVTVKLVCDREAEILAFVPQEYWVILVTFKTKNGQTLVAKYFGQGEPGDQRDVFNQAEADVITKALEKADFHVSDLKTSKQNRYPSPPFITSTLQQEASRKLNWSSKKTMMIAQQLYEGIDLDGGPTGLITYMRTDSTRVADEAKAAAKNLITSMYGKSYLGNQTRAGSKNKNIQDAHEAIRPTYSDKHPKSLTEKLSPDHFKLYKLIWERFIASQMAPAELENTQVIIQTTKNTPLYFLKATGSVMKFDGFTRLYTEGRDDKSEDEEGLLPSVRVREVLTSEKVDASQKFTQPPFRYTEATLIKILEELGIGRPSTYAPTMSVISDRGYVLKEKKTLYPSELGILVNDQLVKYFSQIVDPHFTAGMETQLDEIMEGKHLWTTIVRDFYTPFESLLKIADKEMEKIKTDKPAGIDCEKCGREMVIKSGRFGDFLSCPGYPECKNTKSIRVELEAKCPDCGSPLLERKTKKGRR